MRLRRGARHKAQGAGIDVKLKSVVRGQKSIEHRAKSY